MVNHPYGKSRFKSFMRILPLSILLSLTAAFSFARADDSSIHSVTVGQICPVQPSQGDTWDLAWAPDGSVYSPSNDTHGFHNGGDGNIMFNQVIGDDPTKLDGKTINVMADCGHGCAKLADGCTWKSSGCISLDGVLYWLIARHMYGGDLGDRGDRDKRQIAHGSTFIKSTDGGKTWTPSAAEAYAHPMFPRSRFAAPYFIQYGRDGHEAVADKSNQYVYAISNNGFWDNGDFQILGRVLRSKMPKLDAADWQFYTKGDGADDSAWSSNIYDAQAVLCNPDHLGMTRAVYLPKHQCYFMIGWYYPAGGGKLENSDTGHGAAHIKTNWDFYTAPHPWGPWRIVSSHTFTPQGFYCPGVCLKFNSPDESTIWAFTAGDWTNGAVYKLTAVSLSIN